MPHQCKLIYFFVAKGFLFDLKKVIFIKCCLCVKPTFVMFPYEINITLGECNIDFLWKYITLGQCNIDLLINMCLYVTRMARRDWSDFNIVSPSWYNFNYWWIYPILLTGYQ